MNKLYLIHAYEGVYEGLHGIEDWEICDTTYKNAEDIGEDLSLDIMDSYPCVMNELEGMIEEDISLDYDTQLEELRLDNVRYTIREIMNAEDKTEKELSKELQDSSPYDFIKKYCE